MNLTTARTLLVALLLLVPLSLSRQAAGEEPSVPDTPAGQALEWFLATVDSPGEELVASRLGETFNNAPTPEASRLVADLRRIREDSGGGFTIVRVTEIDALEVDVLLRAKDKRSWWITSLGVEAAAPHNVTTYRVRPFAMAPKQGNDSWGDLTWTLGNRTMPPGVSLRVERVLDGRTKPFLRLGESERVAIAPASKLFPIALLAERVGQNPALLDELVALDARVLSLVSPHLDEVVDAETYAVRELLEYALDGDLTAVDQLVEWLGREDVEAFAREVQGDDSPNVPFLLNGEFFKLKLGDSAACEAYLSAENEAKRRAALEALASEPLPSEAAAEAIVTPTRVREVEWNASADELCDLLARVEHAIDADESGELRAALNDINEQSRQVGIWAFVLRVDGGEPGVFAHAYLLERIDGARFRVALAVEDPEEEIDYSLFGELISTVVQLMAIEP